MVDPHIHSAPDQRPRLLTDLEVGRQAAAAGMRAIVLKSHVTLTADRAALAEEAIGGGLRIFGGLALNRAIGGLNPWAVEAALKMGAKIVWLPTNSATTSAPAREGWPGIALLDERGRLASAVGDIFALVAAADAVLATGHVTADEALVAVRSARAAGVRRLLVSHPEARLNAVPLEAQRGLVRAGALLERCLVSTHEPGGPTLDDVAAQIRATGVTANLLSTDYGQPENPAPVSGLARFLDALAERGFSEDELARLGGANSAGLLGLG
jgi:hypothetical protein